VSYNLRSLGRSQTRYLEEFRASDEASMLTRLAQTECLLEVAKLAGLRIDLASYAGMVVGIITQFVPSRCCGISFEVSDVPPIVARFGHMPDVLAAGQELSLTIDEGTVGTLVVVPEMDQLAPSEFVEMIAAQVSSSLGALVEAERLRRQAAIAKTMHLVELLSDQPTPEDLNELVDALASLPNALGARLEISHVTLGGTVSLSAGAPTDDVDSIEVPGGTLAIGVRWAQTAQSRDTESLNEIVAMLAAALGKAEERQRLRDEAETDPLTGVGNRRRAIRALSGAIGLAEQTDEPIGLVYLDLDYFKLINDTHGHDIGDKVLVRFAEHLGKMVRSYDSVNRIGGEEFLVVCPGLDEGAGARLAQRIVETTPDACADCLPEDWRQTASAGIACYPDTARQSDSLLQAADRALYAAKKAGRNQVCVASKLSGETNDVPARARR
jgi:diguanylate cyclase (GGDEF)-like protein